MATRKQASEKTTVSAATSAHFEPSTHASARPAPDHPVRETATPDYESLRKAAMAKFPNIRARLAE